MWLGGWWLWYWNARRFLVSLLKPGSFLADLVAAELRGSFVGLTRYFRARRAAGADAPLPVRPAREQANAAADPAAPANVAMVSVEMFPHVRPITRVSDFDALGVRVTRAGRVLGTLHVANRHRYVSADRLLDEIVDQLGPQRVLDAIGAPSCLTVPAPAHGDEPRFTVSVVVATYDRPDDLRRCLQSLVSRIATQSKSSWWTTIRPPD